LPIVNGHSIRDYLISYLLRGVVISEVYITDTNLPPGEPDLAGVVVLEVGGDFVRFGQAGSAGSSGYIIAINRIAGIEVA